MAQLVKNPHVGDLGSIPGLGRSPEEGNGYRLQYSGLENSMNREAWQATVHGVTKSRTRLNDFHCHTSKPFSPGLRYQITSVNTKVNFKKQYILDLETVIQSKSER